MISKDPHFHPTDVPYTMAISSFTVAPSGITYVWCSSVWSLLRLLQCPADPNNQKQPNSKKYPPHIFFKHSPTPSPLSHCSKQTCMNSDTPTMMSSKYLLLAWNTKAFHPARTLNRCLQSFGGFQNLSENINFGFSAVTARLDTSVPDWSWWPADYSSSSSVQNTPYFVFPSISKYIMRRSSETCTLPQTCQGCATTHSAHHRAGDDISGDPFFLMLQALFSRKLAQYTTPSHFSPWIFGNHDQYLH